MKLTLLILVMINCSSISVTAMKSKQDIVAIYGFSIHVDPDGRPSECDCRYHKKNMYLYDDGSFRLIEQNGKLLPKYEYKTGRWDIVNNELILSIEQRQYSPLLSIESGHNNQVVTERHISSKTFVKVMNHSFTDGDDQWKYKQGLSPDDLLEKYNNKELFRQIRIDLSTKQFDEKLKFSIQLLKKQAEKNKIVKLLPYNITIDSLNEFKYYFKTSYYKTITAHLNIETKEIVYIEFFEKEKYLKETMSYIEDEKKYEYVGSQHMCNYFNNKKNVIILCPSMENGVMVHVSQYDK